ncbi:MAG: stage II sporulation protein P [Methylocystaceae bacterium]
MRDHKYLTVFFSILGLLVIISYLLVKAVDIPKAKPLPYDSNLSETTNGKYFSLYDQQGHLILQTGLPVQIGDEYYNEDNRHYLVTRIVGQRGEMRLLSRQLSSLPLASLSLTQTAMAADDIHVVIYHTHTDESYQPTDKVSTQRGNGSIMKVGTSLTNSLRENGISVYHSFVRHDPHDINAYHRSRKTVFQLLKQQPDAILDIHRDSSPAKYFYSEVNSVPIAKVMLVIGRQNTHMATNLKFAKEVNAMGKKMYPGLIQGIFMAHGNYNQDLYPTALLIEIGTDTLPREMAENSASVMSDVITATLKARAGQD